ncbi:MAG: hypothetical protein ACFWTM_01270 [Mitsuokella multacida]
MRSDIVKKGATRCAHRSLFHANGYGPEDLQIVPCFMPMVMVLKTSRSR